MKVEIINTNFKDLKTAVCYSRASGFKFIPTVSSKILSSLEEINDCHKSNYAMYLGNSELLSNNDFIQYNFSYYIDKYKFKDGLMINQLDNESRDIIGLDPIILTAMENRLCPSAVDDNSIPDFDYFGSSIFEKRKFFSLDLLEDIYKVEFYENIIFTNHNLNNGTKFYEYGIFDYIKNDLSYIEKPAIIISLGPNKSIVNNNIDWYYNGDELPDKSTPELEAIPYRKLEEEVLFKKTLNIYLPNSLGLSGEVPPLDITLEAWSIDNKNPNRNSYKHILRNNEFYSMINNIRPVKQLNHGLRYDVNSMTLVSNTELIPINECPILKSKTLNTNLWNPKIRYKRGDKVEVGGLTWESLIDNNLGNNPLLSSCWEEEDNLTNYFTNRLGIYFDESKYKEVGIIKPSNSVILTEDTNYLEINAIPSTGFDIKIDSISIYPEYNGSTEIPMIYENEGVTKYNYYHYITQNFGHVFVFKDLQLNLLKEIDYLYIKSNPKLFSINFRVLVNNESEYNWSNWENNNSGLRIETAEGNKELDETVSSITATTRDYLNNIQLGNNELYSLIGLRTESGEEISAVNNTIKSIQVLPTKKEDANNIIIYTILVESSILSLNVVEFSGFIVENASQKIRSGNTGKVRFYVDPESNKEFNKVIINNSTELTINNPDSDKFGGIELSFDEYSGIYTLEFRNIKTNLDIKVQ